MPDGSTRWATDNPGNRAIHAERAARATAALRRVGLWPWPGGRVLDLGCGEGHGLSDLVAAGLPVVDIAGVDPDPARVAAARDRVPGLLAVHGVGGSLPFPDETFTLVVAWTLFSSIPSEAVVHRVAGEVTRVLRPGGVVLWYDMRLPNPRNRQVRACRRSDVRKTFPDLALDLEPTTLLPQLARRLGRATDPLYRWLARTPGLTTHLVGTLRKP